MVCPSFLINELEKNNVSKKIGHFLGKLPNNPINYADCWACLSTIS